MKSWKSAVALFLVMFAVIFVDIMITRVWGEYDLPVFIPVGLMVGCAAVCAGVESEERDVL